MVNRQFLCKVLLGSALLAFSTVYVSTNGTLWWSTKLKYPGSPEGLRRLPTIPHIIHQAWDSHHVPKELADWIKSWADLNPLWEYWLWTPADVRALLTEKYPSYLSLYNNYPYNIFRCDAMRYFIMDTFGGFYVDIDMECFKPLDPWTFGHSCVLSHETYEHTYLLYNNKSANVMTTMMASRPGHPFFKQVIASLPEGFKQFPKEVLQATGPFFLDRNFRKYNKSGNANLTPFPNNVSKDPVGISVVPPDIFLPTFDPGLLSGLMNTCKYHRNKKMTSYALKTCDKLEQRNYRNQPLPESYTDHHWVHIYVKEAKWRNKSTVPIIDIIPIVKSYLSTKQKLHH